MLFFLLLSFPVLAADRQKELRGFIDDNLHFGAHMTRAVTGKTVDALKKEVKPEDIPALIALLGDKRNAIRIGASKALEILSEAALPALEEAAKSQDFNTSFIAKETIGNIRQRQGFPSDAGGGEAAKVPDDSAKKNEKTEKPEAIVDIPLPPPPPDWKALTPITGADLAAAKALPEEKRIMLATVFAACARDAHIAAARQEGEYLRLWIELIGLPQVANDTALEEAGVEDAMAWTYAVYSEKEKRVIGAFNGGPNGVSCFTSAPENQESEPAPPKRRANEGFNR